MFWESLSAWCVDVSFGVVPLAVSLAAGLLLQSTVLLLLGLAAGRLVRSRGAAVQSAVYRTTLLVRRIVRILDGSRTLSIRAGARAIAATILIGGLGTMLVGLVAIGSKPADATAAPSPETKLKSPLGPIAVAASPDGKTLYVAAADAKQIVVVEADSGKVSRSIDMPAEPTGLVLSGDGATLYVTCAAPEGTVAVVDVKSGKLRESIPVGHWPIGPAISPDGKTLYVCNRFDNNVAVVGLATGRITLVPTTREPYAAVVTPDGKSVFVINHLPNDRADSLDVASVVTVIDTATNKTQTIRLLNGSTAMRDLCVSPDGKYVYATHQRARYQMPTTQLERGWMNTNALSVIDARRKKFVNTVLLDDVDLGAANPWGIACTADSKTIVVCHAGTHEVSVIDATGMLEKLLAMPEEKVTYEAKRGLYATPTVADVPNDLLFLAGLRRRIPLGDGDLTANGPRGLAVVGSKAFAVGYFTDTLSVVNLEHEPDNPEPTNSVNTIALGPMPEMTVERRGQMYFHDATLCFQHWQSCASCHPDARPDGLNWDLMNDGLGNPKNTRSMLLAHRTAPSMSSGGLPNAEAAVHSGFLALLFTAGTEEELEGPINKYLKSLQPVPSPHLVDGKLSPAAERGKKLFFDAKINCAKCHPKPLFTDMQMHDVGSRGTYDRRDTFDTPTLIECWRTAPYMHDGHYTTIRQLLTEGKHGSQGEQAVKLTEQQCNDLAEYVLSLSAVADIGERPTDAKQIAVVDEAAPNARTSMEAIFADLESATLSEAKLIVPLGLPEADVFARLQKHLESVIGRTNVTRLVYADDVESLVLLPFFGRAEVVCFRMSVEDRTWRVRSLEFISLPDAVAKLQAFQKTRPDAQSIPPSPKPIVWHPHAPNLDESAWAVATAQAVEYAKTHPWKPRFRRPTGLKKLSWDDDFDAIVQDNIAQISHLKIEEHYEVQTNLRYMGPFATDACFELLQAENALARRIAVALFSFRTRGCMEEPVLKVLTTIITHDPEPSVRKAAVGALATMENARAVPILMARGIRNSNESVRMTALRQLQQRRDESTFAPLARILPRVSDWGEKLEICRVLMKIDPRAAWPIVMQAAEQAGERASSRHYQYKMLSLASQRPDLRPQSEWHWPAGLGQLRQLIQATYTIAGERYGEEEISQITRHLGSDNLGVQSYCASALGYLGVTAVVPTLIEYASKSNGASAHGHALATLGTPEAVDFLARSIWDADKQHRRAFIPNLNTAGPWAVPLLIALLDDRSLLRDPSIKLHYTIPAQTAHGGLCAVLSRAGMKVPTKNYANDKDFDIHEEIRGLKQWWAEHGEAFLRNEPVPTPKITRVWRIS